MTTHLWPPFQKDAERLLLIILILFLPSQLANLVRLDDVVAVREEQELAGALLGAQTSVSADL